MTYQNPRPIAILLAVYNGEKFLLEQIDSLIIQTNQEWTLYMHNDASADRTREIIVRYSDKYDNIIEVQDALGNSGCTRNFRQLLKESFFKSIWRYIRSTCSNFKLF